MSKYFSSLTIAGLILMVFGLPFWWKPQYRDTIGSAFFVIGITILVVATTLTIAAKYK